MCPFQDFQTPTMVCPPLGMPSLTVAMGRRHQIGVLTLRALDLLNTRSQQWVGMALTVHRLLMA